MKKEVRNLIIIALLLTIITTTVILTTGKEYSLFFDTNNFSDNTVEIKDNQDEVEIIKQGKKGNKYFVKLKGLKPGHVVVTMTDNALISKGKGVYVHKSKVITEDNIIGKCTASELIPISLTIILTYSIYILYKKYRQNMRENLYQYRNIAYLGIIIFISFINISTFISIFNYRGLNQTVNSIINSSSAFSILLFPIAIVTFILVTISNIRLIKREGK